MSNKKLILISAAIAVGVLGGLGILLAFVDKANKAKAQHIEDLKEDAIDSVKAAVDPTVLKSRGMVSAEKPQTVKRWEALFEQDATSQPQDSRPLRAPYAKLSLTQAQIEACPLNEEEAAAMAQPLHELHEQAEEENRSIVNIEYTVITKEEFDDEVQFDKTSINFPYPLTRAVLLDGMPIDEGLYLLLVDQGINSNERVYIREEDTGVDIEYYTI